MKSLTFTFLFCIIILNGFTQTKNFIDQPYLEISTRVDTLVVPDRISLSILITETDSKGKISLEQSEKNLATALTGLGIDLKSQLTLMDASSNFKKYFLKSKDIHKSKSYSLEVYDAVTAGKVYISLEKIAISNVTIEKLEHSKIEELKLNLKTKAVTKALKNAEALSKPLGQKIGKALYISDISGYSNRFEAKASEIRIRGGSSIDNFEPIDIEFDKIKITSMVNVKFKLE